MKQVAYVLIGVLFGFILASSVFILTRLPAGKPIVLDAAPTKPPIEVQVVGGVVRPGVYDLPLGSRVKDAIEAAGGLLADTDPGSINMAEKLQDGQQVQLPGGSPSDSSGTSGTTGSSGNAGPFTVIPTVSSGTPTANPNGIDINNASAEELATLPGIGATLAQAIVDYRAAHGPFAQVEDIMNVPGVGVSTFDQIQGLITVAGQP